MLATELKPGSVSAMAGVSGETGERLAEVTASSRSLPLLASASAGGKAHEADRDLAAHKVRQRRRATLVGDMHDLDAGFLLEHLGAEVGDIADAR